MAFLNVSLLLLANFVLLDYLGKLFYERFLEWQANRQIIGNHPEMVGVDLGQDDLLYFEACLLYTSPSPRDLSTSRMPSSA